MQLIKSQVIILFIKINKNEIIFNLHTNQFEINKTKNKKNLI